MRLFFPLRRPARPTTDFPSHGILGGHHVLVVDDDNEIRQLIRTALEMEGALVSEADGVARALERVDRVPCHAVITDITMGRSRRDGVRLLHRLRAEPRRAAMPVIAMTGCTMLERELSGQGFDRVLLKPFEVLELPETIRALLDARAAHATAA